MAEGTKRYAVVSGANKGIGFGICKQLASNGIVVVLTARDEKRGLEALQKLKQSSAHLSDYVLFHQLDVADSSSIAALANFIRTQFGKLDILVNNAAVTGTQVDVDSLKACDFSKEDVVSDLTGIVTQTYELAEECLSINYYGAKRMTEAFIPLLQLSDSPRIVNVSSSYGKLEGVSNEWAKEVLSDADKLSEERIDEVLSQYLEDFKQGSSPETKGWPAFMSSYAVSKAALNAYTRIQGNKFPSFRINCVCPGFVKTDLSFDMGKLSVEEGAESPVRLALLPDDGPSGRFFIKKEETPF